MRDILTSNKSQYIVYTGVVNLFIQHGKQNYLLFTSFNFPVNAVKETPSLFMKNIK